jgi:CheY-like chemotaxis protein
MAILGSLELLKKRMPADPGLTRLLDNAVLGARRGATLTQRMLAFARRQELKTSPTDVSALVNDMRDFLVRSLGSRINLTIEAPSGLSSAQIDANQVELAILNLAINARDAMPEGGSIAITVSERREPEPFIEVRITDTGDGMDPETLKRAIDPFFSTKPLGKGTGLGLSMVHGLARQLGGSLELASEVGHGTQATLWLPAVPQRPAAPTPALVDPAQSRPATILVVDDDALIGMSTADMLQDLGHTVVCAESGSQALEILASGAPIDLLLTDQTMPGMTGVELARIVRGERPDIPILLATGYAELPAGQTPSLPRLSKPYRQAELQAEIAKLLGAQ